MSRSRAILASVAGACLWAVVGAASAQPGLQPIGSAGSPNELPPQAQGTEVVERLGEQVPLELPFIDSTGAPVALGRYFTEGRPVVMALVYYDCPVVCGLVMGQLTDAFGKLDFEIGEDFNVVFASIDPAEEPPLAAERKAGYLAQYAGADGARLGRASDGWGFLVSPNAETARLADALGWAYRPVSGGEYSHPVCIFVLTPEGRIARYVYGLTYEPETMRMALLEASEGKISSSIGDQIRMFCFRYDATTGKYALAAFRVVQLGGLASMLVVGTLITVMLARERTRRRRAGAEDAGPTTPPENPQPAA
ncbi:MAG TPA: SCO family protein [Phycisphaerales bacterium]|nr:SCO family protein [Phycisphaerales bacterium]